ncbi:MAG: glucokinase [Pseudooceanicola sp.]
MTALVGDIGGTRTRLALVRDGRIDAESVRILTNADHADFGAVVAAYLAGAGADRIESAALAAAGPVRNGRVTMTNRAWEVDSAALAQLLGPVVLMNDMEALGRAVPHLGAGDVTVLCKGKPEGAGQALVMNLGTGCNICPLRLTDQGAVTLEAEFGHAGLPATVAAELDAWLGGKAGDIATAEQLFGGVNLARLAERAGVSAPLEDADTARRIGGMLGLVLRDLAVSLLPRHGIYLAGSVAGALSAGPGLEALTSTLSRPFPRETGIGDLPLYLVTNGAAALEGCRASLPRE